MHVEINRNAPVQSNGQVVIEAPIETVWTALTKIEDWPQWQQSVTKARVQGQMAAGTIFKWKAGGLSFTSRIHTMQFPHLFGWTGTTIGTSAVHNWTFADRDGSTLVKVEESLEGMLPRLFKRYFQRTLDQGIQTSLEELKQRAEQS